jgi:hypothetical protein
MSTSPHGTGERPDVTPPPPGPADTVAADDATPSFAATLRRSFTDRMTGRPEAPAQGVPVGAPAGAPAQPVGGSTGGPRPGDGPRPTPARAGTAPEAGVRDTGPRRVRLSLSRIDPWSAMKLSFLLSVALGIMIVVAAAVVWFVLDSMQVFAKVEELLVSIGSENFLQLMEYVKFDRVMSFATIVGVVDVLLLTALGTIGAFLYNIVAALVGGLHVTLTDD